MPSQAKDIDIAVDESKLIDWSWETECRDAGATVSSSDWSVAEDSAAIAVSNKTLTGNVASVLVTGLDQDITGLINTVVLSDGQTLKRFAYVYVSRIG